MNNRNHPLDIISGETNVASVCRHISSSENGRDNATCNLAVNAKCYRKLVIIDGEEIETAGCLGSVDDYIDQCNHAAFPVFRYPTDFQCCWDQDMCNDHLQMNIPKLKEELETSNIDEFVALIIAIITLIVVAAMLIVLGQIFFKKKERKKKSQNQKAHNEKADGIGSKNLRDSVEEYSTVCSSGSGMRLLTQCTIARQIEILGELGRGRYGTVKLGRWREEYVAVKVFNSTEEKSWAWETEIYQTVLLRHENILCFVASDINGTGSWTELYLITDYHCNGSLYDYLQNRAIDLPVAMKLASSAASGLSYLHTEIIGSQGQAANQGKPAIAHRDIKSKNILVKAGGSCCIADLGLAVIFSSFKGDGKGALDKGHYTKGRQGTVRYMSPEILNESIDENSFDAFKSSDVYSFALVLWEILNCTSVANYNASGQYRVPYYDVVGNDPDFNEMRKVVDVDGIRPEAAQAHADHSVLSRYIEVMSECWVRRAESRLTMLRVRKTLDSLWHRNCNFSPCTIMNCEQVCGCTYVSDRSNSSGFPTNSTYGRGDTVGPSKSHFAQRLSSDYSAPVHDDANHRLLNNGCDGSS